MQHFSDAEIEFFIDTNGRLSAERALVIGTQFVKFVEAHDSLGEIKIIEIVYLGRGSFRARLMIILRDPATATLAGLASLALAGVTLLRDERDDKFVQAIAAACIDSGASRCGFRTADTEFAIEREEIAAVTKMRLQQSDDAKRDQKASWADAAQPRISQPSSAEGEEYSAPAFEVEGILDLEDGLPVVKTMERAYSLTVGEGELPPPDRLANFQLRGPRRPYGDGYALEGWTLDLERAIETLIGRMVERHGGRAVSFETADRTFAPIVPDDTLGWVPMGALVEVKGIVSDGEYAELTIFDWRELDEPKSPATPPEEGGDTGSSVELIHSDAAPLSLEERSSNRSISSFSGKLRDGPNGLEFAGFDGGKALIDGIAHSLTIPNGAPIEVEATLRRGSRGGMGDPRLIIWNWRPIEDVRQLSGRVFTGVSDYVLHTDDGARLRIVGYGGRNLPTAEHLLVFARFVDAPSTEMTEASIEILDWRRIDE
jgi:hypothetical protein